MSKHALRSKHQHLLPSITIGLSLLLSALAILLPALVHTSVYHAYTYFCLVFACLFLIFVFLTPLNNKYPVAISFDISIEMSVCENQFSLVYLPRYLYAHYLPTYVSISTYVALGLSRPLFSLFSSFQYS